MKKLIIIPVTFLVAGSFFLSSCRETNLDAKTTDIVQNNADTTTQKVNVESAEKKVKVKKGKKNKQDKKNKKDKKTAFFKPARIIHDANSKIINDTQSDFRL